MKPDEINFRRSISASRYEYHFDRRNRRSSRLIIRVLFQHFSRSVSRLSVKLRPGIRRCCLSIRLIVPISPRVSVYQPARNNNLAFVFFSLHGTRYRVASGSRRTLRCSFTGSRSVAKIVTRGRVSFPLVSPVLSQRERRFNDSTTASHVHSRDRFARKNGGERSGSL